MALDGTLRFGVPHDFATTLLPSVLAHLSCIHPQLHVRAHVDRRLLMLEQLEAGALDMVLAFGVSDRMPRGLVATLPIVWIGPHSGFPLVGKPVPLLLSDPPCSFRHAVIEALDRANIPWRIAFTSPNLPALWAATEAGLGIMPRTAFGLPKSLTILPANSDLPMLPDVIGIILEISTCTVRIHIQCVKRKLNAVNIPHAVYLAFVLGILRL
jgi:DNA-binding transcriptional LysR family regulator